jgi:hypothetical protein
MALNDIKVPKENSSGTFDEITLPDATTSARGLLTSADKTKLDGLATTHAASHAAGGGDQISSLSLSSLTVANPSSSPEIRLKGKTFFGNYTGTAGLLCESTTTFGEDLDSAFGFTGVNEAVTQYKSIGFTANGTPQLFLKNDGNVGVGTLTPAKKLDVAGEIQFADSTDPTKQVTFDVGGISTGQVRTLNVPNASGRIQIEGQPIGNNTRSTGAFTTLSAAPTSGSALTLTGGTVTASAPLIDATQTWNDGAVTFTGLRVNITNTASGASSIPVDFQVGGSSQFRVRRSGGGVDIAGSSSGVRITDYNITGLGGGLQINSASGGTGFLFDSGNIRTVGCSIFEQRTGTTAQTFRIYNTFTSTTSFERLNIIAQSAGSVIIGTEKGSAGGTARGLQFVIDGVNMLELQAGGSILANRSILTTGGYGITSDLHFTLQAATGQLRWGSTSSVPMLKRSSITLQVRLGNDSAFAPLECAGLTLNGDLTASTRNIVTDTTTGTKIGTGTTQLLGFWNAAPSAQPAAVADATDAASVITQLNALLARLRTLGLIAT